MDATTYSFLLAWFVTGLTLYRYVPIAWRDPAFWGLVVFALIGLYVSSQRLLSSESQINFTCMVGMLIGCITGYLWSLITRPSR